MSGNNAGFAPRELARRKFQEVAATAIDKQAGVIGQLVESINQTNESARVTREFMADLSVRVDGCVALSRWEGELAALIAEQNVYAQFMRRSFWGRLRWLLTGA